MNTNKLSMQVLQDGHWTDVVTRARSENGFHRIYRQMLDEDQKKKDDDGRWPEGVYLVAGMRIITVWEEHLGAPVRTPRNPLTPARI